MSEHMDTTPPGHGKPRFLDDDDHTWVEMDPGRLVSWFDRNSYPEWWARGFPREHVAERWCRIGGLRPTASFPAESAE